MLGIAIAQFYRLEDHPSTISPFGYFVLARPLSLMLQGSALAIILLGSARFLRQQNAMAIGKVHAGGWEMFAVMALMFLVGHSLGFKSG